MNIDERGRVCAALILVSAAVCLLGGCGGGSGSSSDASSPSAPNTTADGDGAEGAETLTWAKDSEVAGLDPQLDVGQVSWDILFRVYEPLVRLRDDGTVAPLLATSWKRDSPRSYTFQLRRNARFSNGRAVTPADVVATFNRVLDPKLGSSARGRIAMIKRVVPQGRHAVRFLLTRPSGTFVPALASIQTAVLPGNELKAGDFDPGEETLGTGPYKVAKHLKQQSWTLVRNPHYWRDGYPKASRLEVLIVNDPAARMAALRSGRADVATFDDTDTPKLLGDTPNVRVAAQDSSDFYVLDLNTVGRSSQLKDERVRRAIALALDRQQIIELALGGAGKVVAGAGTVPGLPDACDTAPFAQRDVDQAKALIAEANADGLEFDLLVLAGDEIETRIAQVIQAQLEEIGLRPRLQPLEQGAFIETVYTRGEADASVAFRTAFADNWFGLANWSPSTVQFTKAYAIDDPTFNRLLDESSMVDAGPERTAIFQRMCEIAASAANTLPLATRTMFVAYRTDRVEPVIQAFETHSDALRNIAEFVKR